MASFEEKGIERQYDARNIEVAMRRFKASCDKCCNWGIRLECDRCGIAEANRNVVNYYSCHTTGEVEDFQRYERWAYA